MLRGRKNGSMVCAWALAALWLAGCDARGHGGTSVDGDKQPVLGGDKPIVGQSGSEGSCGYAVGDAPPNMPFDFTNPARGFSGKDVADAVAGSHRFVVALEPWFEAPSADPATRSLTIEIMPKQMAADVGCGMVRVPADVRLRDDAGALDVTLKTRLTGSSAKDEPGLGSVLIDERFSSPEYAAELGLPPAADPAEDADQFRLIASFDGQAWTVLLGSQRGDLACDVLVSPNPSANRCSGDHAATIGVHSPREIGLSDALGHGLQAGDLVDAVNDMPELGMNWPDGSKTSLHIEATPEDFACTGLHDDVAFTANMVLVPLQLHLTTRDGKLDVTLPAQIHTSVPDGDTWDKAELDTAMVPSSALKDTDWNALFDVPQHGIGFIDMMATVPVTDDDYRQLNFEVYKPYAGVPAYPSVYEYSSNRIACFGTGVPTKGFETNLTPMK